MRAQNIAQLNEILQKLFTTDGVEVGLTFQPRATDIIISPFAKCGTTWIQQTVHGLRTRGSMDFGEITEVTPWLEAAADLDLDLESEQVAFPRAYKSHLPWDTMPQGGKYICVFRDPMDALISMYKFFEGWLMEPGAISFETFAYDHFLARQAPRSYWHHLVSWYNQKNNDRVLLLCYEHLQQSFDPAVQLIADFMEIELDEQLAEIVYRQSSLTFMQENGSHFDDHFLRQRRDPIMGLASNSTSSKVSSKQSRSSRPKPSQTLIDDMQTRWRKDVGAVINIKNYGELLEEIHYQ